MNLLIFCPYYPPHVGGLEKHAWEFNKYLIKYNKNINITVFTPQLPKEAIPHEVKYNKKLNIIRFPAFEIIPNYPLPKIWNFKFWKLFLSLFKTDKNNRLKDTHCIVETRQCLVSTIKQLPKKYRNKYNNYDIVLSRTRFFNTSLLALFYAKIKRVKWIHIEHGSDSSKLNNRLFSFLAKVYDYTFGKLILALADKVIANSKASAEFCRKLVKNKKYAIIYRGVEIEKIKKIKPSKKIKKKYPNKVLITFAGRLFDGKGLPDLLKAISNICAQGSSQPKVWHSASGGKIQVLIIGSGPKEKELKLLTQELNLENKVAFLGYKKTAELIAILKASHIFVNPSYTEGLPSSVIEAALCKLAIISTNVGGTPEIITNNKSGYLIEPRDVNLLKKKLEKLIKNKNLRAKFGNNAYNEVAGKFSWNKAIEKYLEVFEDII